MLRPSFFQDISYQIHADVGAFVLDDRHAERTESAVDSVKNETGFLAPGTIELAEALLEFTVGQLDDGNKVIDVWPRIMRTLMPALGALFQGFVIPILVLFDETLEADIASVLEPQVEQNLTVPIPSPTLARISVGRMMRK